MATFNRFHVFTTDIAAGTHDACLNSDGDTLKVYLSNATPDAAADLDIGDMADLSQGSTNGYTAGGEDVTNVKTITTGQIAVAGTDVVWTASGGTIGPFKYVVLYNDSQLDKLIGWWDYGSSITLQDGESFTVDFGTNIFTVG